MNSHFQSRAMTCMVIGWVLELSGLNGSSWYELVQAITPIARMSTEGTSHQIVSATRLWSSSGEYLALVLPSRYFQAKIPSRLNTGTTTINDSRRVMIISWRSFWAIGPLGSSTGILVWRRYQPASSAKPRANTARPIIFFFPLMLPLLYHPRGPAASSLTLMVKCRQWH